jgi:hypothetical protein
MVLTITGIYPGILALPFVEPHAGGTEYWYRDGILKGIQDDRFRTQSGFDRIPERRATDHNFRHQLPPPRYKIDSEVGQDGDSEASPLDLPGPTLRPTHAASALNRLRGEGCP